MMCLNFPDPDCYMVCSERASTSYRRIRLLQDYIFIILMRHEDIGKPGVLWINQRVCGVKCGYNVLLQDQT